MGEEFDAGHPHQADGVRELGVVSGHDEVARPAQHEAGGDAPPLYGGNRRLDEVAPSSGVVQVPPLFPVEVRVDGQGFVNSLRTKARVPTALHVVTCGEVLPLATQHHNSDLRITV